MDAAKENLDKEANIEWLLLTGPKGQGILTRLEFPSDLDKMLPRTLYFLDDKDENAKPEDEFGSHTIGYTFKNVLDVKQNIKFRLHTYYSPKLNYQNRSRYLNIVDKPIQIQTKDL